MGYHVYESAHQGPKQWYLQEDGSLFQWIGREHCLVLTGYDNQYYYFNDPLSGKVKYAKSLVETRFSQLGKQSLVIYESSWGKFFSGKRNFIRKNHLLLTKVRLHPRKQFCSPEAVIRAPPSRRAVRLFFNKELVR